MLAMQVIQIAMKTGAHVVRGNHDDGALAAYNKLKLATASTEVLPLPVHIVQ